MKSVDEIIDVLNRILVFEDERKKEIIINFQNNVWNEEISTDKTISEIVSELAYDLDFYERNNVFQKEDVSYYSDAKLRTIIITAIEKLRRRSTK